MKLNTDTRAAQIRTACVLECAARKPGNVHPGASFADLTFADFVRSAEISAPILAESRSRGVGRAILDAVTATRTGVATNTNLGMLLLLAPLAAIPPGTRCCDGIAPVLAGLTMTDTKWIYEAIRLANPGGLGSVESQDVSQAPTVPIVAAMALAADRDLVARQYAREFEDVLVWGSGALLRRLQEGQDWETAVVGTQLEGMARTPDSLIRRKCGAQVAVESQRRAGRVLEAGWPNSAEARISLQEFDRWLRGDGHKRNPGTTADLIAASLFVLIRDGDWTPPGSIDITEAAAP